MATHSSVLAWGIPGMGKPGGPPSMGSQSRTQLKRLSSSSSKGTFHPKMGTIKNRNGMDLTEAEDIKKGWQEYTELYKKDLSDPDNHNGMITHLEPDILSPKSSGP